MRGRIDKAKYAIVSLFGIIIIWQMICMVTQINPALFPTPKMVWDAFAQLVVSGLPGSTSKMALSAHIIVSLQRFLIGYLLSVLTAVLFGLLLGCIPNIFAYINPIIQIIRPVAPVAFLPFIVLMFGIGNIPAIVIIFIAGFFPILLSTVSAVANVDEVFLKVAKNYGLSRVETVFKVIFPGIFHQVVNSVHLALGTAWIFLVSGEMVGTQSGLGFLIMDTKNCIRMDSLVAVIITIGVIGFILDEIIKSVEKLLIDRFGIYQPAKT